MEIIHTKPQREKNAGGKRRLEFSRSVRPHRVSHTHSTGAAGRGERTGRRSAGRGSGQEWSEAEGRHWPTSRRSSQTLQESPVPPEEARVHRVMKCVWRGLACPPKLVSCRFPSSKCSRWPFISSFRLCWMFGLQFRHQLIREVSSEGVCARLSNPSPIPTGLALSAYLFGLFFLAYTI